MDICGFSNKLLWTITKINIFDVHFKGRTIYLEIFYKKRCMNQHKTNNRKIKLKKTFYKNLDL